MNKLLIVDGMNLLFQMFFGMPSRIVNRDGKSIHGVLGFIGAFIKILKMTAATHAVILFDGEHENPRSELLPSYKANRPDYSQIADSENPFSQLQEVYNALDFMGVKHTEIDEHEADDVIASYAHTYGQSDRIVIASFDSDFFQLITDNVSVLRYRGDKTIICDEEYIWDKYCILPCQYGDFKALTGDSSDNIRGADGIGPKIASALINQFGSLDEVIARSDEIKRQYIRATIIKHSERLKTNRVLINLRLILELPFEMDELIYAYDGITTHEVLRGIGLK